MIIPTFKTLAIALVASASITLSCSKDAPPPAVPPKVELLVLQIRALESANEGRSVRMLIRRVDPKQFANETYDSVVALAEHPDASVLSDQLLRPRSSVQLRLPLEADSNVGVYFLFTHLRADSWRVLIPGNSGEATIEAQRDMAYAL
jgi:predicted component of type VI protein secretion system